MGRYRLLGRLSLDEFSLTNPEEDASSTARRLKLRDTPIALLSRF
jgi:hypothetical protein